MAEITYDRVPDPDARRRLENWNTAIGLQAVDNLAPSEKLLELAREHVDGKRTIDEIDSMLKAYYVELSAQGIATPQRQIEADVVSANIERLLETDSFALNEGSLKAVHKVLFRGFDEYTPGEYRTYDFTKSEWVLRGDTVTYEHWEFLEEEIIALIRREKGCLFAGLDARERVARIVGFVSELWLCHAFREGNTRTIALLTIKYLRSIGYRLNNEAFEQHALFFRNALIRANYRNEAIGVTPTNAYLMQFFGNILLGEDNELKNRRLHIYWNERTRDFSNHDEDGVLITLAEPLSDSASFRLSSNDASGGTRNGTLNGTANDAESRAANGLMLAILDILASEPTLSYDEIADRVGKGRRTVARAIRQLKDSGAIQRVGSDKSGHWIVT
jgi:fido (protein-threonine AMPylation protein)/DNA-binding transcriptional ArsR family regulator